MKIVNHANEWYLLQEKKGEIVLTPLDKDKAYDVKDKISNKRTTTQNASLHKLCSLVSIELNNAGYSVPFVLNKKQHSLILDVFKWGKEKMPSFSDTLQKMEDRLIQKNEDELTWSMLLVKELLWKKLQKALLGKESTTQLEKGEIDQVYMVFNRLLSEKFGITVAFPSIDELIYQQNYKG